MAINIGDKVMVNVKGEPTPVTVKVVFTDGSMYGQIDDNTFVTFKPSLVIKPPSLLRRVLVG